MTNNKKYSNTRATLAIAKASFRSILRSPSAVVFTLAFPLIFIIVFANIGGGGMSIDVGVAKGSDTSANNPVYTALKKNKIMHLINDQTTDEMNKNLAKGNIDAILDLKPFAPPASMTVHVQYSKASGDKGSVLKSALNNIFYRIQSEELKRIQGLYPEPIGSDLAAARKRLAADIRARRFTPNTPAEVRLLGASRLTSRDCAPNPPRP